MLNGKQKKNIYIREKEFLWMCCVCLCGLVIKVGAAGGKYKNAG